MHKDNSYSADFLPVTTSLEDLKAAVLANLDDTLNLIQPYPNFKESSGSDLLEIPQGFYALEQIPDLEFWKRAVKPNVGVGEVGLIVIKGRPFISVNKNNLVNYPDFIKAIYDQGIFDLDIHTHPYDHS